MWHCRCNNATGGLIVLAIGAIFLLRNLGIIAQPVWSILWPCLLIIIGIGILVERRGRRNKEK